MAQALVDGIVLAESDQTEVVEGNHYFPPDSLHREYFRDSQTHTVCGWKGTASYFDIVVDGREMRDAAWYYPSTKPEARHIEGYVAFGNGVQVQD